MRHYRKYLTATLFLLSVLVKSRAFDVDPNKSCVQTFWHNRTLFDDCKTQLCFTFLFEEPYVNPDDNLINAGSIPFRCRDHRRLYNQLKGGLFFDMLHGLEEMEDLGTSPSIADALCVYAGNNCTFDEEVAFVNDAVSTGEGHLFIAGGALLFMEHRRTVNTSFSQAWFTDSMVLLHRPRLTRNSFPSALIRVFQPFQITGWIVVTLFGFLLSAGLVFHVFRFSTVRQPRALLRWFFQKQREVGIWEHATWNIQKIAVVVFFSVLLLLYEISVVNFILQGPEKLVSNTDQLKGLGLKHYAIVRGAVSETIFKYAIGWVNDNSERVIPWMRANSLRHMIDTIMSNPRGQVRYVFTFASTVRHYLFRRNLCNDITVTQLEKTLVGGWYYGASIAEHIRVRIDKALSVLDLMNVPRKELTNYGVIPIDCGDSLSHKIGYEVLFVLLLLTVGPLMVLYVVFMLFSVYWRDSDDTVSDQNIWGVSQAGDSFISSDDADTGVTPLTVKN